MPSPKPKRKRPVVSATERAAWLEKRLCQGIRATEVVRLATAKWGLGDTAVWVAIREIKDRWLEESAAKRPEARAEVLMQVDALVAAGYAADDLSAVAKGLALKSELHGLRLKAVTEETGQASSMSLPKYLTAPRTETPAPHAVAKDGEADL